jgi:orotidine-5'-phosphate decarboxylase
MKSPHERIVFALDVPSGAEARKYLGLLGGHVGAFKVGPELLLAAGPDFIRSIQQPVMLDLKLHDIPETIERAVLRAGDLGVKFLTLHVQQREAMRRAVQGAEQTGIQLLAVTMLTSMNERDCRDLRFNEATCRPAARANYLAGLAWEEGITGLVTSPLEVEMLRAKYPDAVLVCPAIRPPGADAADQKRKGTPGMAVKSGADYLVLGRPIRDADDPRAMVEAIAAEITAP